MSINIWEKRIVKDDGRREPEKAFKYFNEYLLLGGGRTLRKVAEQTGKSYKYMEKLSCTWDWSKRANAYDMWLLEENKREFEEKTKERYLKANRLAIRSIDLADSELDNNPSLKEIKVAGNLAAKLLMKESSVNANMNVDKKEHPSVKDVFESMKKDFADFRKEKLGEE
ncbi:MAG: hypothetical protein MJ224_04605 [archaeon]|nr:hypothetical protein [archaeon]